MSYSQFLSAVLHKRAIESGRMSCSVTLEVEDEDEEPISLTRKWHFRVDGSHKLYDDELLIFEGVGRVPRAPPVMTEDKEAWYRDYIAQIFIPPSLAEFFLFDGEQVQRYANRGMAEQVRRGIEGLLGLPVLRALKESLGGYAQARRAGAAAPSDQTVKTAQADIAALDAQVETHRIVKDQATALLPVLELESEQIAQQLGNRGEGTVAMVADLIRKEERFRAEAGRLTDVLSKHLDEDVSLGLVGAELRQSALSQLDAEAKREKWEAGRSEGNSNLDRYIEDLGERLTGLKPALSQKHKDAISSAAKEAWEALWHPPPEGCAETYLHESLIGVNRSQAIERITLLNKRHGGDLNDLVVRFRAAVDTVEGKKRERLELEQNAPESDRLSARLREVSEEVGRLRGQSDDAERALTAFESQLGAKRQELGRYTDRIGKGAPALRRATHADKVATLIDKLLIEAVPSEVAAVAREMTRAWKSMAHFSDRVDRIEITPTCEVKMLNEKGEDLHLIDKSAGASQVFTQALITAVTNVGGRDFPFIVDTPLARLSRDQRIGVLRTFTDRSDQVILLSTDEEVVDDKLASIRERIAASYRLGMTTDAGVAVTSVVRDEVA